MDRPWSRALRKIATTVKTPPAQVIRYVNGTIATVTAGAATDGRAQVTVTVGADTVLAPYLSSYTPNAGDLVSVRLVDGSPLILGAVYGTPTF